MTAELTAAARAASRAGCRRWDSFLPATLATAAVHLASNVSNDLVDDASGADCDNDDRISPFSGGSRVLQDGQFDREDLERLVRVLLVNEVPDRRADARAGKRTLTASTCRSLALVSAALLA